MRCILLITLIASIMLTGLIQNFLGMVMGGELMAYTCLVKWAGTIMLFQRLPPVWVNCPIFVFLNGLTCLPASCCCGGL